MRRFDLGRPPSPPPARRRRRQRLCIPSCAAASPVARLRRALRKHRPADLAVAVPAALPLLFALTQDYAAALRARLRAWAAALCPAASGIWLMPAPGSLHVVDLRGSDRFVCFWRRSKYLYSLNNWFSTLGGAYAAVQRAEEARRVATRQLRIARLLGNDEMEIRAQLYLAYYLMSKARYEEAIHLARKQKKAAAALRCRPLIRSIDAALTRIRSELRAMSMGSG